MERVFVKKKTYHDSAFLMRLARELEGIEGVKDAVVLMGTEMNRNLITDAGFSDEALNEATPMDLIVALRGKDEDSIKTAQERLESSLTGKTVSGSQYGGGVSAESSMTSLGEAMAEMTEANLVSVAVPGAYAGYVAAQAVEAHRHVFLFSDNVSIEDEIDLKRRSVKQGLFAMGPDCGTAVIGGVGLGFSNRVKRGNIGIVGPSGTGMQEISCGLDAAGRGVSQAIGTGSRDLGIEVGGLMTMMALRALDEDPETKVCVLVAKDPHPLTADMMHEFCEEMKKPVVVRYLGKTPTTKGGDVVYCETLDHAVSAACSLLDGTPVVKPELSETVGMDLEKMKGAGVADGARLLGLFGGGSLAAEAAHVLKMSGLAGVSMEKRYVPPKAPIGGKDHMILDLGDDHYTVGRPHPMIDQQVRCEMIRAAGEDPGVGVVLFDLVLGDGAHENPAPELAQAFREAAEKRPKENPLLAVASVSGTEKDPQNVSLQRRVLADSGVFVQFTSTSAARLAADFMKTLYKENDKENHPERREAGEPEDSSEASESAAKADRLKENKSIVLSMDLTRAREFMSSGPRVIHLGLKEVAAGVMDSDASLTVVPFRPPAGGDEKKIHKLKPLRAGSLTDKVLEANRKALERFFASEPNLVGVGTASEMIPGMTPELFLHAGPPLEWERASGPIRGAVIGGAILEGLAKSPEEAEAMAAAGKIRLEPCHHHNAVGPMAGLITSSMPVWIVEDAGGENKGSKTFCTLNEGLGKVLRYGAYSKEVIERLRFMSGVLAPVLAETLKKRGPIDLKLLMAQALQMGDEGHNRNRAGTSLLFRELAPVMVTLDHPKKDISRVLSFIEGNDHFFLNLTMPMAKCMLRAAESVPYSSMLTAMARNGTDFGIRVSGLGDEWYVGPAQVVDGLFFPGFSQKDANPDIGDSTIMETAGLGGFAMAASPAIVQFVGGNVQDAYATTRRMRKITIGRNNTWALPPLDFAGTPTGIDLLAIIELGILPAINTGIAHKDPGVGQVGAGLVDPPWECFEKAFDAFYKKYAT